MSKTEKNSDENLTGDNNLVAMAIGAHPDDIEFMMAGTLLLLKQAGAQIHVWNLATGNCGTAVHSHKEIVRLRWEEARDSARVAGARIYPPIADDLKLFYDEASLQTVAARIRQVKPNILLCPSPQDYMEDHQNACRLAVTGAFARGMRNFPTSPAVEVWTGDTVIYHALPYGLRDGLRRRVRAGSYVGVGTVMDVKRKMLSQHRTQKEWLDASQGLDAYLTTMEDMCAEIAEQAGRFEYAEGWRRHSHLGFTSRESDPLAELLGDSYWKDPEYEKSLD